MRSYFDPCPSEYSSFILFGTSGLHHFQSLGPVANVFPEFVAITVWSYNNRELKLLNTVADQCIIEHTRSNAATRLFVPEGSDLDDCPSLFGVYLPMMQLLFIIRHTICGGSFCETGLKKFATDLPTNSTISKKQGGVWEKSSGIRVPTRRGRLQLPPRRGRGNLTICGPFRHGERSAVVSLESDQNLQ